MRERLLPCAIAWTLVTGISSLSSLAHADEPVNPALAIGLGYVEYSGEFPIYFQDEIGRTIAQTLERAGSGPIELAASDCRELECVQRAAQQADLDVFVMSRARHQDRDYELEFVAYASDDGRVLAQTKTDCIICGQQELLDAIPAKLVELDAKLDQALAAQTGPAWLTVYGSPGHANLTLDGEQIGSSPATLEVESGEHQLEISALGHAAQVHRWTAANGVEQRIDYALSPNPVARGYQIGGWVSLSLGAAGAGAGLTLLLLDGQNHRYSCGPDLIDVNGECPNIYRTAAPGYVALGLGVAAIATGAALLLHHSRRDSRGRARVGVSTQGGLGLRF